MTSATTIARPDSSTCCTNLVGIPFAVGLGLGFFDLHFAELLPLVIREVGRGADRFTGARAADFHLDPVKR